MWKEQGWGPIGLGSLGVTALLLTSSASAQMEDTSSPPMEIDKEIWSQSFSDQRILFGVGSDGSVTTFVSSERERDSGGYPMEDTKLLSIAIEIGGANTKVCWTSGGEKHCDPPPPP